MTTIAQSNFNDEFLPIITLLIGAFFGFLLGYWKDILNFKRTTAQENAEQIRRESLAAQKGFVKLYLLFDAAQNTKLTIDRALSQYNAAEFSSMADNQKFRGIAGLCDGLQRLDLGEIVFLFRSSHPFLFSDVLAFEKRIHALGRHLDQYTTDRGKLVGMLEQYATSTQPDAPHLLNVNLPTDVQPKIDRMSASLDEKLRTLLGEAENCAVTGTLLCRAFLKAAQTDFQAQFPENVDIREQEYPTT